MTARSIGLATAVVSTFVVAGEGQSQVIGRRIEAAAVATVTFDDNVGRGRFSGAGETVSSAEDVIWSPGVTFGLNLPVGRQVVFVQSAASYSFYQRNDWLNSERLSLQAGVQGQFARCSISPTIAYSRGLSEGFDAEPDALDNIVVSRGVGLSVGCPRQNGFYPFASVRSDRTENNDPRRQTLDSERDTISGGVSYGRATFGTVSIVGTNSEVRYPSRPIGVPDGYDLQALGLSYERKVGARLTGRANVDYTDVTSRPGLGASDFQGVTWGLAATAQPSRAITLDVSYDRSIQPSNRLGLDYSVTESVGGGVRYALNSRTVLSGGVQRNERRFEGATVPGGFGRTEDQTAVFVSARYALNRRVSFTADARREERASDRSEFSYNSNRVSFSAQARF